MAENPIPRAWSAGETVADRFRLAERVGRGGSVTVWRARDRRSGERVALKRPRPDRRSAPVRRAFEHRREVLAALAARDPPPVFPAVVALPEEAPYLAVEFVAGDSLAERPPSAPGARRDAVHVVADACAWLHDRGRVHCDLRPENVRRTAEGDLRVVDLGSVRERGRCPDCESLLTAAWLGSARCEGCGGRLPVPEPTGDGHTPGYRAPELDGRSRLVGPWTDVYGLARLADALATGDVHPVRPPAGPGADLASPDPAARPATPKRLLERLDDRKRP